MASKEAFYQYTSANDGRDYLAFFGQKNSEYEEMLYDIVNFNKYKKNLELYTQIEAFENWQDTEDFGND